MNLNQPVNRVDIFPALKEKTTPALVAFAEG
jgi:hypothetical protein